MVDHEIERHLLQRRRQFHQVAGLDPELHVPAARAQARRQRHKVVEAHAARRHRLAVLAQQVDAHAAKARLAQLVEPALAHLGLQQRHAAQPVAMSPERVERHLVVSPGRQRMDDRAARDAHPVPQRQQRLDRRLLQRRELAALDGREAVVGTVDMDVAVGAASGEGEAFLGHGDHSSVFPDGIESSGPAHTDRPERLARNELNRFKHLPESLTRYELNRIKHLTSS